MQKSRKKDIKDRNLESALRSAIEWLFYAHDINNDGRVSAKVIKSRFNI